MAADLSNGATSLSLVQEAINRSRLKTKNPDFMKQNYAHKIRI